MTILNYANKDILLERYFGSNKKEFEVIENELKKIISYVKKTAPDVDISKLNKSPETEKIKSEFKKLFNLEKFEFFWMSTNFPNAFCFVRYGNVFSEKKMDGYKGLKGNGISVYVSAALGLITTVELNEKELVSVLLHELGHQLYYSKTTLLYNAVSSFLNENVFNFLTNLLFKTNVLTFKLFKAVDEFLNKISVFRYITSSIEQLLHSYTIILDKLVPLSHLLVHIIKSDPKKYIGGLFTRGTVRYFEEKNADAFAADFGYGPHLISALQKMKSAKGFDLNEVAGQNVLADVLMTVKELENTFLAIFFNPYPSEQNRYRSIVDRLKKSLEDPNLPKELKKQLLQDIKEAEEAYERYLSLDGEKRETLTSTVRIFIDKNFGGKLDVRELVYKIDDIKK